MTTDEIIMTRPKEQDYFIRATYVRQLENYCDELENEIIEQLVAERDELRAKLAELASQEPVIWQSWHDSYGYGYWDTLKEAELNSAVDFEPVPLYAAPGAKQ